MEKNEKIIFLVCILGLIIASIFSLGYHHFDEHFQILEFAGSKLGLTSPENLPWEYHSQMRPSIQPVIAILLYKTLSFFGISSPFSITLVFRLLSALLAFVSMRLIYRVYCEKFKDRNLRNWFLVFSFFLWFVFYIGVRFSSENWSGIFFTIAFCLYFLFQKRNTFSFILIGLVLGLSFLFRYQSGFLVFGFLCWASFIKREKILNLLLLISGVLLISFFGVLIDRWFYGEWTLTIWNYIDLNLIQDKVSSFGVEPWWWYFEKFFLQGIPPLSLLFIIGTFIFLIFKPKSPITWSIIPFLLIHFVIGHKELRFLFPIVYFLPVILIEALNFIQERYMKNLSSKKYIKVLMKLCLVINFVLLMITFFKPPDPHVSLYKKIYNSYKEPTVLNCIAQNPYHRVLDIHFYKRKNLTIREIQSLNEVSHLSDTTNLIAFTNKNKPKGFSCDNKLIYSSIPQWLLEFDFNSWQKRINIWYVYELEPSEN